MFTRIDHITVCVADLELAIAQYRKLGFHVAMGGVHTGRGTHNAIAFNDADYIELLAIRDADEYRTAVARGQGDAGLDTYIAAGGGLRAIMIQSDDLAADVAAMRARGVEVSDATEGGRRTPDGVELRWKVATLGPRNPLPLAFIEHLTPLATRRAAVGAPAEQPNRVFSLERSYIVVEHPEAAVAQYATVLGMAPPPLQKGTVIMSHMAIFQIGATGLGVVNPYAEGPAAAALRRGAGPFQALYRTKSMGAAARWMNEQGLPPLERGVRNTGEQAMLATPKDACGAYIGFVGME